MPKMMGPSMATPTGMIKAPLRHSGSNKPKGYQTKGVGPDGPAKFNKPVKMIKHSTEDAIDMAGTTKRM